MSLKSLLIAALLSGCSLLMPSGPSNVARGEYYAAGTPEYDGFFISLHRLQVELLAAPSEAREARRNLTQSLGLTVDASDSSLISRLDQELKKLAHRGLRVRLEVPEPTPTLDASATLHTSEAATPSPVFSSLPRQATRLVRSRNRMLAATSELDKLRVDGIKLEGGIDQAFRVDGPWKRAEVRSNLSDGQKLITLMQSRAKEVQDQDQKLLTLLTSTATTDPNLGRAAVVVPPPAAEIAVPSKPVRRSSGRPGRAPAAASKPAPARASKLAPAPKPAPARPRGGDEDAPAPRPTQGNAPAEIEP